MGEIDLDLPVDASGSFDLALMTAWADFQKQLDRTQAELKKLLSL